jgi:hypothetical protein
MFSTKKKGWESLGISDKITEAVQVDRSGSAVLEELLRR